MGTRNLSTVNFVDMPLSGNSCWIDTSEFIQAKNLSGEKGNLDNELILIKTNLIE